MVRSVIGSCVILVGLMVATVVARLVPVEWEWENSPVEWAQVGVLCAGMVFCLIRARAAFAELDRAMGRFWLLSAPPWLFLAGREMSWGRVLFVQGYSDIGPVIVPMRDVKYGTAIEGLVCFLALLWLVAVFRYRVPGTLVRLAREKRFPVWESGAVLVACGYWRYAAEILQSPVLEEFLELVAYIGMLIVAAGVGRVVPRADGAGKKVEVRRISVRVGKD